MTDRKLNASLGGSARLGPSFMKPRASIYLNIDFDWFHRTKFQMVFFHAMPLYERFFVGLKKVHLATFNGALEQAPGRNRRSRACFPRADDCVLGSVLKNTVTHSKHQANQ